jgi:hypothetical protein
MRTNTRARELKLLLVGLLVGGWLLGLMLQRQVALDTGYLDVSPFLMVLGMALCALAGVVMRIVDPAVRKVRAGALAGVGVLATILAGYFALVLAYIDTPFDESGGETWFSFLLEAWFWIGIPLVVSAALGAIGWLGADLLGQRTGRPANPA